MRSCRELGCQPTLGLFTVWSLAMRLAISRECLFALPPGNNGVDGRNINCRAIRIKSFSVIWIDFSRSVKESQRNRCDIFTIVQSNPLASVEMRRGNVAAFGRKRSPAQENGRRTVSASRGRRSRQKGDLLQVEAANLR